MQICPEGCNNYCKASAGVFFGKDGIAFPLCFNHVVIILRQCHHICNLLFSGRQFLLIIIVILYRRQSVLQVRNLYFSCAFDSNSLDIFRSAGTGTANPISSEIVISILLMLKNPLSISTSTGEQPIDKDRKPCYPVLSHPQSILDMYENRTADDLPENKPSSIKLS